VANRRFADERGGALVLRIDDTDAGRSDPEAESGILRDLEWLGLGWDEGPVRQSERGERYRASAARLLEAGRAYDDGGAVRFDLERRPTLLRPDGTATYHLASVVDDVELSISHVIRGRDHLPNTPLHEAIARALGADPPEYLHHGLLVGADGQKLSKRHGAASVADLRDEGIPAEAVRAYLEELGLPRHDVHLDLSRLSRLSIEAIAGLSDDELAARVDAPRRLAPALRGARTLAEAREIAARLARCPPAASLDERGLLTVERFRELRERMPDELDPAGARGLLRELKAVGGDLRALRVALTGQASGPELWAVLVALPREEALARVASGSHD
jgi:glutamyl/glutaminyl-tRNA synthetase